LNPLELVQKHLGEHKIKGDEINVKVCPFCKPQKKDNYWKFFVNKDDGVFYCHRQNNCGVSGSFYQLLEHFDEVQADEDVQFYGTKLPNKRLIDYFSERQISKEIVQSHDVELVTEGDMRGGIAFNYYKDGKKMMQKVRNLKKGKNKVYKQAMGGKAVLWEIDYLDLNKPVVITEGEIDKLALHQSGIQNVVSVPFGSNNFKWVDNCWDTLQEVKEFIICPDNDKAGKKFAEECYQKLGREKCRVAMPEHNDINEQLYYEDEQSVRDLIKNAKYVCEDSWLQFDEIETFKPDMKNAYFSVIPLVNKYLRGYRPGEITIWSGTNGSGKTTFLLNEMLNIIEREGKVAILTGEAQPGITKFIMSLQLAGESNLIEYTDEETDEVRYRVDKDDLKKMGEWLNGKLYIYNNFDGLEVDRIQRQMEIASRRFGCNMFVIDNLMKVQYGGRLQDRYNQQAQFVSNMKDFSIKHNSHIHVVAHPRKPKGVVITKEDVAGLYEITNNADNVIGVHRTDKTEVLDALGIKEITVNGALEIYKNRMYGDQRKIIPLDFEKNCRRFNQFRNKEEQSYSWQQGNWKF